MGLDVLGGKAPPQRPFGFVRVHADPHETFDSSSLATNGLASPGSGFKPVVPAEPHVLPVRPPLRVMRLSGQMSIALVPGAPKSPVRIVPDKHRGIFSRHDIGSHLYV